MPKLGCDPLPHILPDRFQRVGRNIVEHNPNPGWQLLTNYPALSCCRFPRLGKAKFQVKHRTEFQPVSVPEQNPPLTDVDCLEDAVFTICPTPHFGVKGNSHAAAFTDVDESERQPEKAFAVNAQGTRNVAQAARKAGIPMLYISTDYVFDGEKTEPYVEEDAPHPLGVYGKSKPEGEMAVRELVQYFWIVRTSWLFGPLGRNFVRTIAERARAGDKLRVVDDQVGAPTYTMHLVASLEQIVTRGGPGIYHATNQGHCSWFEFAKTIVEEAGLEASLVSPSPTLASGRQAPRPKNSRLACTRFIREGLVLLPPWREGLRRYLEREHLVRDSEQR